MPKLNLGKVVGDKGDPFVFEDFTSEQLDGLTPKMLKGNVTTLDPDQNATVDIRKEGLNNYIDFGIPRGLNGSEIKSISAENVEMSDGNTLENTMATVNENIAGIEEPVFDDTTDTYASLAESNAAAETASNAIQSHTSIFSTLSNMKKSLSAIVQGLKVLGSNVGGIRGISSALDSQREDIAASSKAVSLLNSNLNPEILTNGFIDFNKYYRIDLLIRENRVASGIYTASFINVTKYGTQVFSFLAHNIDHMFAGIAKIEFKNNAISVLPRVGKNLNTGNSFDFTYTIIQAIGYK